MLHTYLGRDLEATREKVRGPMKQYLSNFVDQFRPLAEDVPERSSDELESLLEFAFERYFETSSLLGTVEKCSDLVAALADAGVDEVACLTDFGLDSRDTLESLEHLAQLRGIFAGDGVEENG
jgi:alkanesulfonate monooxygenase SsuD/methylene tetrahydromethanopterin reductase-like flavin-dependent oxidoreductase (luciferase family)